MADIPLQKAKTIIKEYRENGFNASKALVRVGYKQSTATKGSKSIINNALKKVVKEEMKELVESSSSPRNKLLQMVGMSEQELYDEYMFIVKQNKDLTNKLKAMQPLLATQGIKWNEEQTNTSPTLNLTVKSNNIDNVVKDVTKDSAPRDIEHKEMAQQSDETERVAQYTLSTNSAPRDIDVVNEESTDSSELIEEKTTQGEGGGVDSLPITVKEGISPSRNFEEKSTIDTSLNP